MALEHGFYSNFFIATRVNQNVIVVVIEILSFFPIILKILMGLKQEYSRLSEFQYVYLPTNL